MARTPDDASSHERAHARAGSGEGLSGQKWWRDSGGNARVQHNVGWGKSGARKAAVVQAAGYLSSGPGFADRANDRAYAQQLAREAGVPLSEIEAEARRKGYVINGSGGGSSGCLSLMMVGLLAGLVAVLRRAR